MPLYRYIKAQKRRPTRRPLLLSFCCIGLGSGILLWVAWPILTFFITSPYLFAATVSPLQEHLAAGTSLGNPLSPIVMAAASEGSDLPQTTSFTNVNLWFPGQPQKKVVTPVNTYKLSIPKLKIQGATVIIGGNDLDKSLIHYGGTGIPGDYGTTVIFGHSTLPQFFNPSSYITIFSTLPTLRIGDEIFVEYDGVRYRYAVYDMQVTQPTDLSPLEQRFDDSYITLITCVPPGTVWARLNVKAKLVHL